MVNVHLIAVLLNRWFCRKSRTFIITITSTKGHNIYLFYVVRFSWSVVLKWMPFSFNDHVNFSIKCVTAFYSPSKWVLQDANWLHSIVYNFDAFFSFALARIENWCWHVIVVLRVPSSLSFVHSFMVNVVFVSLVETSLLLPLDIVHFH